MLSVVNLKDISPLQEDIMIIIDSWIRKENTPVPQKEIISLLEKQGKKNIAVQSALSGLLKKGYLRRAQSFRNHFIQLKSTTKSRLSSHIN